MNLNRLRLVQQVAESGSFSAAARACHTTQPTVSNAISQLEEELGGRLFARTTRSVQPTAFGVAVLPQIQAVLSACDELTTAADAYWNPAQRLLRIGFSPLVDTSRLHRVLAAYREAQPQVAIFFKECLLSDLSGRLAQEQIDVAVIPVVDDSPYPDVTPFYSEPLYYLPREMDGETPPTGPVYLNDLPPAPVIITGGACGLSETVRGLFVAQELPLNEYQGQALSYQVIEEWASLGIGAGVLPVSKLSSGNCTAVPLMVDRQTPASVAFQWVWGEAGSPASHLGGFRDYAETTVTALVQGEG